MQSVCFFLYIGRYLECCNLCNIKSQYVLVLEETSVDCHFVLWAFTDYLKLETESKDIPDHTLVICIDFLF